MKHQADRSRWPLTLSLAAVLALPIACLPLAGCSNGASSGPSQKDREIGLQIQQKEAEQGIGKAKGKKAGPITGKNIKGRVLAGGDAAPQ